MAIPTPFKLGDGSGKPVLKRALADTLPADVLHRPKLGFPVPTAAWFRGELGDRLEDMLNSSALAELGYLDLGAVRQLLAQHRNGRANRSFQLWNVLNLGAWCEHWLGQRDFQALSR
jgi:asparagine synthase (glutamine-hydrolysing)